MMKEWATRDEFGLNWFYFRNTFTHQVDFNITIQLAAQSWTPLKDLSLRRQLEPQSSLSWHFKDGPFFLSRPIEHEPLLIAPQSSTLRTGIFACLGNTCKSCQRGQLSNFLNLRRVSIQRRAPHASYCEGCSGVLQLHSLQWGLQTRECEFRASGWDWDLWPSMRFSWESWWNPDWRRRGLWRWNHWDRGCRWHAFWCLGRSVRRVRVVAEKWRQRPRTRLFWSLLIMMMICYAKIIRIYTTYSSQVLYICYA